VNDQTHWLRQVTILPPVDDEVPKLPVDDLFHASKDHSTSTYLEKHPMEFG
jgi:hypothetical protein